MRWSLILGLVVALSLSACGKSTPASESESPAPSKEAAPATESAPAAADGAAVTVTKVTIAGTTKASLKNIPLFIGDIPKTMGVEFDYKEFKGGGDVATAVRTGATQFALAAVSHPLKDANHDLKILAVITRGPGHTLLVRNELKSEIKTPRDLVGRKVGVSSVNSATHESVLRLLANAGVTGDGAEVRPVGNDPSKALASGEVDAAIGLEPYVTRIIKGGSVYVLMDSRKPEGVQQLYGVDDLPWIALVAHKDVVEKQPEVAEKVVKAVRASLEFIATQPAAEIVKNLPEDIRAEAPDVYEDIVEANRAGFSKNGTVSKGGLTTQWNLLKEAKAVSADAPLPWDDVITSLTVTGQ